MLAVYATGTCNPPPFASHWQKTFSIVFDNIFFIFGALFAKIIFSGIGSESTNDHLYCSTSIWNLYDRRYCANYYTTKAKCTEIFLLNFLIVRILIVITLTSEVQVTHRNKRSEPSPTNQSVQCPTNRRLCNTGNANRGFRRQQQKWRGHEPAQVLASLQVQRWSQPRRQGQPGDRGRDRSRQVK